MQRQQQITETLMVLMACQEEMANLSVLSSKKKITTLPFQGLFKFCSIPNLGSNNKCRMDCMVQPEIWSSSHWVITYLESI